MTEGKKIEVLVVEDSTVVRMFLVRLLESDARIRVVGAVADGQAALDFVSKRKPDVVLMDIHMPRMDGFEATRRIMEAHPVPIVICTATAKAKDVIITFQAMEAGAIACIQKPLGLEHGDFEEMAGQMLETVKLMSEVKVVRRTARVRPAPWTPDAPGALIPAPRAAARVRVIGIGASTGGPPVLQTILAGLRKDFPVPVLVVQHIAQGFLAGMAEWLNQTTGLQVHIGSHGTLALPGHVYLAPDSFHMGAGSGGEIVLTREEPQNHLRPAVSFLFRTLAQAYGPAAVGVLLTGMGSDGAAELKQLRDTGAITIAQDRESSVIHGMPGAAIALGGATHVLPANQIAGVLARLASQTN
jgi:two-component system, chemotaxis family, protein-glutamate methylesterase/glutaminase